MNKIIKELMEKFLLENGYDGLTYEGGLYGCGCKWNDREKDMCFLNDTIEIKQSKSGEFYIGMKCKPAYIVKNCNSSSYCMSTEKDVKCEMGWCHNGIRD